MSSSSLPNPSGQTNIFTLAADGSPRLLEVLRSGPPSLAWSQDATGYSVLHALASYNHVSQLRQVWREFFATSREEEEEEGGRGDVNLTDEDGETALFVAETVAAAQCLVEEVGVDWRLRNAAGETAEEKIRTEGDFVTVADYLAEVRKKKEGEAADAGGGGAGRDADAETDSAAHHPPPLPPGVKMEIGSMTAEQLAQLEPDPEFKRRIEELAARDDFQVEEGQAQLRQIVKDAVRGVGDEGRDVRQRTG